MQEFIYFYNSPYCFAEGPI